MFNKHPFIVDNLDKDYSKYPKRLREINTKSPNKTKITIRIIV